jgi:hypothetical protein
MHCPNCGLESSTDLKFCRGCGLALEEVSRIVATHASGAPPAQVHRKEDKAVVRRVALTLFWSAVVVVIGGALAAMNRNKFHNDVLGFIAGAIVFAGMIGAMYSVLSPMWQQRSSRERKSGEPTAPIDAADSPLATPRGLPEPPASITETTTRVLEHDRADNTV